MIAPLIEVHLSRNDVAASDSDSTLASRPIPSPLPCVSAGASGEPLAHNTQSHAADAAPPDAASPRDASMGQQLDESQVKQARTEDAPSPARIPSARRTPEIEVRQSAVHGKGVFACKDIEAGRILCEYRGEILTWQQADRRRAQRRSRRDDEHTFLFQISKRHVIDATSNGCRAKWINHSCTPNCQAVLIGRRVFIETLRPIAMGEELFFDYQLQISDLDADGRYRCHCASPDCRGTLLSLS